MGDLKVKTMELAVNLHAFDEQDEERQTRALLARGELVGARHGEKVRAGDFCEVVITLKGKRLRVSGMLVELPELPPGDK